MLLAAYHPSLQLLGISTVHGNAPLSSTTHNALRVLQAIGKPGITVHPGAVKPFCRPPLHAPEYHGESGLDGTDLLPQPIRSPLIHCNAIKDMRDALMACPPHTAWLVTTGAMTNAGLLFAIFPEVAEHIKGLSIMGGSIGDGFTSAPLGFDYKDENGLTRPRIGNTTVYAEFNILCDPESAQSVFSNPVLAPKTILIPLDVTHQAFVTNEVRERLLNPPDQGRTPSRLRRMFSELLIFFSSTYAEVQGLHDGPPLHDPLAVAALLATHPDGDTRIMFDDRGGERWDIKVVLNGEQTGRTIVSPSKEGSLIPRTLDLPKFWQNLDDCLYKADEATGFAV